MLGWWRLQRKASNQLIFSPENEVVRRLRRLVHSRYRDHTLRGHRLRRRAERAGSQGHARFDVERQLVALSRGDELELQAGRPGF